MQTAPWEVPLPPSARSSICSRSSRRSVSSAQDAQLRCSSECPGPDCPLCGGEAPCPPGDVVSEAALPGAYATAASDFLWSPAAASSPVASAASSEAAAPRPAAAAAAPAAAASPVAGAAAAAGCPGESAPASPTSLPPQCPVLHSRSGSPVPADSVEDHVAVPFAGEPQSPVGMVPFLSSPMAMPGPHELASMAMLDPTHMQMPQALGEAHTELSATVEPAWEQGDGEDAEAEVQCAARRMLFAQPICSLRSAVPPADAAQSHPCPRFGHTAVVYKDQMVVFGGRDARCYDDVWTYCFLTKQWKRIPPSSADARRPRPRAGHTAVVHQGRMYVFGGVAEQELGGHHTLWLNDLWMLDLETWRWEQIRSRGGGVPAPRKGHTAVVNRKSMFIYGGGQDDQTMQGDLWEFSFATHKWVPRRFTGHEPQPRMYHVAVAAAGGRMIVFGGRAQTSTGFLNDLFEINLSTFKCEALTASGPAPTHRMCSTAVYHNHTIAIFTGGSYAYLEDSHQLDLRKMQWIPIDDVRFGGRTRPTTVKWRNTVLTFGGCVHGNGYVNDFIELELEPMSLKQCMKQFLIDHKSILKGERIPDSLVDYIDD
eukprot:TRINITY_DN2648_c0_g2_i1.p1 TRINITY_DN2648_c0_g2~~TRINITY_DN2648_c0_g2_i1.p1  ORF type:complete len:597 (+),score=150.73 TRINITY_DN2648_c0_g2_i1:93-1883(+)